MSRPKPVFTVTVVTILCFWGVSVYSQSSSVVKDPSGTNVPSLSKDKGATNPSGANTPIIDRGSVNKGPSASDQPRIHWEKACIYKKGAASGCADKAANCEYPSANGNPNEFGQKDPITKKEIRKMVCCAPGWSAVDNPNLLARETIPKVCVKG
jgi:hypothetical protein